MKSLISPPPHALGLFRKRLSCIGITVETLSDFRRTPDRPIPSAFALAGVGEAIAMAAKEISAWSVQLGDAPPATDPVHDARADEIGSHTAESQGTRTMRFLPFRAPSHSAAPIRSRPSHAPVFSEIVWQVGGRHDPRRL